MSLKQHTEYKASGLPLTPMVPSHWQRTALKHLGGYQNGYPFKPEDRGEEGLPIIRISQLTSDDEPAYFDGELDGRVKIRTGDLLFSWSATIDSYIWNRGDAWLNQHIFKVTESQEAVKGFLYYVIKHVAPKLADFDAHGSTMRHIKKESLGEKLYIPPRQEQLAIASFLDRETAKIDALIGKQQRLIELLQEKRQAVISHAVTKGLNPNAPMKDSGVEWLGEVPEHWECLPLKRYVIGSNAGEVIDKSFWGGSNELLYTCAIEPLWCDYSGFPEWKRTTAGDLLLTRNGTPYVHQPVPKSIYTNVVQRITILPGKNREYLAVALQNSANYLKGYGVSIESLNYLMWSALPVPLPPLEEQASILEATRDKTEKLDALLLETKSGIQLLQERRSALISAAVTGQIDVRGLVPEAAEE